jgi:hypothetical protein
MWGSQGWQGPMPERYPEQDPETPCHASNIYCRRSSAGTITHDNGDARVMSTPKPGQGTHTAFALAHKCAWQDWLADKDRMRSQRAPVPTQTRHCAAPGRSRKSVCGTFYEKTLSAAGFRGLVKALGNVHYQLAILSFPPHLVIPYRPTSLHGLHVACMQAGVPRVD